MLSAGRVKFAFVRAGSRMKAELGLLSKVPASNKGKTNDFGVR